MKCLLTILLLTVGMNLSADDSIPKRQSFLKQTLNGIGEFIKNFSNIDTSYIEPQHYNYALMVQNTNTYEVYRIKTQGGNEITFAPQPSMKLGPYFGWRWVFLGYTIDLTHLGSSNNKKEFDLSLYSSKLGIDIFYRKTGNDYKIRNIDIGEGVDTHEMKNMNYDGLNVSIKGFNLYYIFNHKKFSYPAAFSQSTVQRRSSGSLLTGIGYTRHSLSVDWNKLYNLVGETLGEDVAAANMDKDLSFGRVKYTDVSASIGYAYNWVFAHNWLFASSWSMALGYKHTQGDSDSKNFSFRDFSMKNMNFDGVGRFGIVWNNTKWFVGASTILHSYSYKKENFSSDNYFGSLNIYIGFNFDRR